MKEESKQNKYIVKWQEIVTYEVEIEAHNKDEAQDLAQENYGFGVFLTSSQEAHTTGSDSNVLKNTVG